MTHPCACCALRFATTPELADHVREEHAEHPAFEEGRVTVIRPRRFPRQAPAQPSSVGSGRPAASSPRAR